MIHPVEIIANFTWVLGPQNGAFGFRDIPRLFQANLGWWDIINWPNLARYMINLSYWMIFSRGCFQCICYTSCFFCEGRISTIISIVTRGLPCRTMINFLRKGRGLGDWAGAEAMWSSCELADCCVLMKVHRKNSPQKVPNFCHLEFPSDFIGISRLKFIIGISRVNILWNLIEYY